MVLKNRIRISQMKFATEFHTISELINFVRSISSGNIFFCSASTVARATRSSVLSKAFTSGYAIPDSTPLALLLTGNREYALRGTTFMRTFAKSADFTERILLIGSTTSVLEKLRTNLKRNNKNLNIVGIHSPSFEGTISEKVKIALVKIKEVRPNLIFVSLSSPQQDLFILEISEQYRSRYFAVGAAFDFLAGTKLEAPLWLQKSGFEWVYRLGREPRRLWKRYLMDNSIFILASIEFLITNLLLKIKNDQK